MLLAYSGYLLCSWCFCALRRVSRYVGQGASGSDVHVRLVCASCPQSGHTT